MGGRGSCYLNYNNNDYNDEVLLNDIFNNAKKDEDTLKEHNGKTQKLKDKNIHIKESTDHIEEEVLMPNINKVDSLTRKYIETSNILDKKQTELAIRSDVLKGDAVACFIGNSDFSSLQIILKKDLSFANRERAEAISQNEIDTGSWSKSDKNEAINHPITHEFGHYVQRVLMEKDKQTKEGKEKYAQLEIDLKKTKTNKEREKILKTYSEDYATKYFKEIQRIHRRMFGVKEDESEISRYGRTSNTEAFAELFANLNTTKQPYKLSLAMEEFLKEHMNVKGKKD